MVNKNKTRSKNMTSGFIFIEFQIVLDHLDASNNEIGQVCTGEHALR
jgi:hypothetical protein